MRNSSNLFLVKDAESFEEWADICSLSVITEEISGTTYYGIEPDTERWSDKGWPYVREGRPAEVTDEEHDEDGLFNVADELPTCLQLGSVAVLFYCDEDQPETIRAIALNGQREMLIVRLEDIYQTAEVLGKVVRGR